MDPAPLASEACPGTSGLFFNPVFFIIRQIRGIVAVHVPDSCNRKIYLHLIERATTRLSAKTPFSESTSDVALTMQELEDRHHLEWAIALPVELTCSLEQHAPDAFR